MTLRILAIGGGGFIGRHTIRLLVAGGHSVIVVGRSGRRDGLPSQAMVVKGDRNSLGDIRHRFAKFRPHTVVDFISYTEQHARSVVDAVAGIAERIVVVGSADVYRNYGGFVGDSSTPPDPVPLAEDSPVRDRLFPYRSTSVDVEFARNYEKLLVERVVLSRSDLPGTVLRLGAVYGPADPHRRVATYLDRMEAETEIVMTTREAGWTWSRSYVENAAAAVALASTESLAAGRVYNVADEPPLTEIEWVKAIATAARWGGRVVQVDADAAAVPDHAYDLSISTRRIRDELGYAESVSTEEALRRTIASIRPAHP